MKEEEEEKKNRTANLGEEMKKKSKGGQKVQLGIVYESSMCV